MAPYGEQVFDINETDEARKKLNHRRSRKACQQCHVRKIRCNVVERGTPCSNCVDAGKSCTIRARKNERTSRNTSPSSEHRKKIKERCHSWQIGDSGLENVQAPSQPQKPSPSVIGHGASPTEVTPQNWAHFETELNWSSAVVLPELALADDGSGNGSIDLSHLADLNDVFSFTRDSMIPGFDNFALPTTYVQQDYNDLTSFAFPDTVPANNVIDTNMIGVQIPGLSRSDEDYLRREGCLTLPPTPMFREMMQAYFFMVHPNLPMVIEDQFWALWTGDVFRLDTYSFLLVKAMIFASVNYMDSQSFTNIGTTKREARIMYYKQAKTLFEFGVEKDPISNAQACMLLTYYSPPYNWLRVNTHWLTQAIRFARVAKADLHYHRRDKYGNRSRLLRRIWWCIIMRDRILCMGLRRASQVALDPPPWSEESSILTREDFTSELGKSPVHDLDTQNRIIEVLSMTCRLMQALTRPLQLYRYESPAERLRVASTSLLETINATQTALNDLRKWHDLAIRHFPFPIALDDAHENPPVCVYANLMFCYHSAAVFALNQHLILLSECLPLPPSISKPPLIHSALESLESSNHDIGRRIQEFVQVRLTKYLPISATAFIAIPLILQAFNVAAARGTSTEGIENRRLEVFLRTLKVQQENFDGSDHAAEVLGNVVAYAQADERFISSMESWREEGGTSSRAPSPGLGAGTGAKDRKVKLDWPNMVHKRPRLFLRLMLYIDHAMCWGGPPDDEEFPPQLRKDLT